MAFVLCVILSPLGLLVCSISNSNSNSSSAFVKAVNCVIPGPSVEKGGGGRSVLQFFCKGFSMTKCEVQFLHHLVAIVGPGPDAALTAMGPLSIFAPSTADDDGSCQSTEKLPRCHCTEL